MSRIRAAALLTTLACLAALSGCVSVPKRNPLPEHLVERSVPVAGSDRARAWGDEEWYFLDAWLSMTKEEVQEYYGGITGKNHHYLAISGGGANGAFGAGLLCGWTESGTRPEFTMVTGISTGALIAPFAFLGPEYDDALREFYTSVTTKDLVKKRNIFNVVTSDAAVSSKPLQELLEQVITQEIVDAIAAEHRKGRALAVGTTYLDAQRPVHWDIGEIAISGDPRAPELIRKVLLASASLPGVFPPVLIEVEAEGEIYDEMHVDGGAAAQVFLYPVGLDWELVLDKLDVPKMPDVYVIRNSRLHPKFKIVKNKIFPIMARSAASMVRTQGIGNMFELYLLARRDGLDYHLAYIPDDFEEDKVEQFDPEYMKALFERGYEMAKDGYPWAKAPPGYWTDAERSDPAAEK